MHSASRPDWSIALRPAAVGLLCLLWAVAAHYTSTLGLASSWGAALGLLPFIVVGVGFAWRSPARPWMLGLCLLATGGLAWCWPLITHNVAWLYFIQHVATNTLLGIGFGRTLAPGRTPMVTFFASLVQRQMSPALLRYTRYATLAWTVFFILMVLLSLLLFAFGSLETWSVFANLLTMPLVLAMFAGEFALRFRYLPPQDRAGILATIQACRLASLHQAHERAK